MVDIGHINLYNHMPMLKGSDFEDVIAEYVWIDGKFGLRSKTRTLEDVPKDRPLTLEDLPKWNFDGSSCYMADTKNSEIVMKPVAMYKDPFRGKSGNPHQHHLLVLCATF